MKVYILMGRISYESAYIVSGHLTREKAEKTLSEQQAVAQAYNHYYIEEVEVE